MIGTINALLALLVFEALLIAFLVALVAWLVTSPETVAAVRRDIRRRTGDTLRAAAEARRAS